LQQAEVINDYNHVARIFGFNKCKSKKHIDLEMAGTSTNMWRTSNMLNRARAVVGGIDKLKSSGGGKTERLKVPGVLGHIERMKSSRKY
jgi:hypothetical protein